MAIEITMKHTTATKNVYPATSPNHILVTANIRIAKNGKILVYGNYWFAIIPRARKQIQANIKINKINNL